MNKMTKLLLCILLLSALPFGRAQQTVTQEQCQQADAQLNQIYQQLRGTLNDDQKQRLKLAQRDWIKKRDAYVAANPGNPQGALYQKTIGRVAELKASMEHNAEGESQAEMPQKNKEFKLNGTTQIIDKKKILNQEQLIKHLLGIGIPKNRINSIDQYCESVKERANSTWDTNDYISSIDAINDTATVSDNNNYVKEIGILPHYLNDDITKLLFKDLSVKWPREKNVEWNKLWLSPAPSIQHKINNKVISYAESDKLYAKSYKNDTRIFIYDKKNNIEINAVNLDELFYYNRDSGLTPQDLCFSKDGKLLAFRRNTTGYFGGVIYVLNTDSLELTYQLCAFPCFYKNEDGSICLKKIKDFEYKNRQQYLNQLIANPELQLYVYDCSTNEEKANKKNKLIERLNREESEISDNEEQEDQHTLTNNADCFIQPVDADNGKYAIRWCAQFGNTNILLDIHQLKGGLTELETKPSTSEQKKAESEYSNITMPCFWAYLVDKNHSCADYNCKKDISNTYIYISSDKHWLIPKYEFDLASQPSGWQCGETLGVYDLIERSWIALPNLIDPWENVYVPPIIKTNTNSSVSQENVFITDQLNSIRDKIKNNQNIEIAPISGPSKELPICLPSRIGPPNDLGRHHYLSLDQNKLWISTYHEGLYVINLKTKKLESRINALPSFQSFVVSNNLLIGIQRINEPQAEVWSLNPVRKISNIFFSEDGSPLFVTNDGFFSVAKATSRSVAFRAGNCGFPLEQFDLRLNRPDIVLERLGAPKEAIETAKTLREKRLKRMGVTEQMLKPDFHLPELQIVGEVPASTTKDQLDLQIKATDDKYPLDRLRVYVNNVPVNGRDGELLRYQKTQSLEKTIPIKLATGRNKIQVSVLNSAGAESLYANAEVNCTADRPKPKLYAVALGVSQYDRPEWCLKYAAKDATDLIGKLKAKAGSSYSEVKPLLLTDKEVTKESAAKIKEFLSTATIDDTVLIFMAGHGLLDDKYDYYFGTTDIDPAKPSERGMPYEAIDNILAEVPSLKKALLMDTCHAGELDDDEKKELATSDGKGALPPGSSTATESAIKGTVAMRAIGTRGMTVKAVEGAKGKSDWYEKLQDMFVDLRRGSGATVISSSQGAEYAFESSEQSNGLFTYSLMEALDGKATPNKDGQITISSIGDYVKKRVQDLTKGKQNPNLRGVNLEEDFTLGTTR